MQKETVKSFRSLLEIFSSLRKYRGLGIKTAADIAKIPFTRRLELQDYDLDRCPERPVIFYEATGGREGSNFFLGINKASHDFMVRRAVSALKIMGVKKGGRCLNLLFSDLVERGVIEHGGVLMQVGDVHNYKTLKLANDALGVLGIRYVFACPNLLWDVLMPLGRKHSVEKCMVSGELLLPWFKNYFQNKTGIRLYNWYGSSGGFIAAQDDPEDEYMRVLDDGLFLEVIDENGITSQTGTGTLVYTDLHNYSSPLIRYILEDKVRLIRRRGDRYIKIFYRYGDHLKLDGELVYKNFLVDGIRRILKHDCFFIMVKKGRDYQDSISVVVTEVSTRDKGLILEFISKKTGLRPGVRTANSGDIDKIVMGKSRVIDLRRNEHPIVQKKKILRAP